MSLKPKKLEQLLRSKFGFLPAKSRSKDHRCYELSLDGLPPIHTKVSHSKKDIGSNLLAKIARQMRVHKPFFDEMMGCTIDKQTYENQIRVSPYPPFENII
jgi:hypothetical protein